MEQMLKRMESQVQPFREKVYQHISLTKGEKTAAEWLLSLDNYECKHCGKVTLWETCLECDDLEADTKESNEC